MTYYNITDRVSEKKVLIISYYWPPAGGPGVQRWLKFAKYLPHFGWKPIIFVPENPSYPLIDNSLLKDIPKDLEVIKNKIWEPYQLAEKLNRNNKKFKAGQFDIDKNQSWKSKLSIWIRGNLFIPDARIFWVKSSIKKLKKYLKDNHIDVLVTTGPPHSLHLIGLGLKREFPTLKWIADFRDPWTEISYYKHLKLTKKSDRKHRYLEQEVFKNADVTLATSFTDAHNFSGKGANAICITNGFDDEELSNIKETRNEKFTLSYIGVLEQLRNPIGLWQVLEDIIIDNESFRNDFQLKFVGKIDNKILEYLYNSPLKSVMNNLGYLVHNKALEEMKKSDILLLTNFPNESSKGIIPGKVFEYLATKNHIISFGPKDSDVEKILNKTKLGRHFTYSDRELVKKYIMEQYYIWKNNIRSSEEINIEMFSRKNLTGKLVEVLNNFL